MNADEIIARAAPPPERADASVFEPVATDADSLARRRDGLTKAFGSPAGLAAHAEALGLAPDAWVDRFRDVRLAGPAPDWGRAFRAVFERVSDGPKPFAEVRRWAQAEARAAWPAGLPAGPEVLEGPLDHLAMRIGTALHPTYRLEYRLGHQPTWRKRFERSPALGYAIGRVTADWLADLARTLRRAADDRALLARAFFGGEDPGALAGIEPGLGDSHAGGCSVAILRFERGGVVYKPKDLRVAVAVGEIADRLTGTGLAPPATLARDGYAWEPVYEAHPIAGRGEADAFYGALGGWLALLQALGGSDFWFDNLIADGAVPRFVDFETAVQPPLVRPAGMRRLAGEAAALVEVSPLGAGILPLLMPTRDGEARPTSAAWPGRASTAPRCPTMKAGSSPGARSVSPRATPGARRRTRRTISTPSRKATSASPAGSPPRRSRPGPSRRCSGSPTRRSGSSASTPGPATGRSIARSPPAICPTGHGARSPSMRWCSTPAR